MGALGLDQDEQKAVEQTRQRLQQLCAHIAGLKADVFNAQPFPSLDSLQASADILFTSLQNLTDVMASHNDLFSRYAIHPSTNFPGRTQENILFQLLRKKKELDVEEMVDRGRNVLDELVEASSSLEEEQRKLNNNTADPEAAERLQREAREKKEEELRTRWDQTKKLLQERILEYVQFEDPDPYTAEEREMGVENVRTGLRRDLEGLFGGEDDEDDDEGAAGGGGGGGDDDVMIVDRPAPPGPPGLQGLPGQQQQQQAGGGAEAVPGARMEDIMRFVSRGGVAP